MGRAARWFRNLWSGSKENKQTKESSSYRGGSEARAEKKRWSFRKSQDSSDVTLGQNAASAAAIEAAWFKCFYDESKMRKSKNAISAAASVAVAVADAAAAVVHLAGNGASVGVVASHESAAAMRIQTVFRGYLARKAHRALKALVKLQALVRGYLVRKEAAATLHSMQALIRAQATVRAQRSRNLIPDDRIFLPEIRHRRSLERLDIDVRNRRLSTGIDGAVLSRSPNIVEIDTWGAKLRPCFRYSTVSASESDASILHSFTSPFPSQVPGRISIPSRLHFSGNEWWTTGNKCRLPATAHSTPRCSNGSVAPGKFCSSLSSSPNYMANTQSSTAKLRKRQPLSEVHLNSGINGGTQKPYIHQPQEPFAWLQNGGGREARWANKE